MVVFCILASPSLIRHCHAIPSVLLLCGYVFVSSLTGDRPSTGFGFEYKACFISTSTGYSTGKGGDSIVMT